ncbi:putative aminoglycoside nucleotidyltransferase [Alteracholeplasma palmae J233]|uniref:Putative aminoglycoside nucleotidyltransferase n=1 Tax=Alteracholeplasma palmae (strain ATCC 49389 / J233) TaxID=1318466 RepID=U4KR13_ALTPJ|nr:nucleotidyltransferase family protein [Alteracholeplasma palmae]CCV63776.1 putative aminoglycoside nucleotidyltransferase [Alteracholeplasma palmae J233]
MVNLNDATGIIKYITEAQIDLWLDGGWGVDALLNEQTRAHNDIDIFIQEKDKLNVIQLIKEKGFIEVIETYTTKNHTVWQDNKNRIIDLHIFNFIEDKYVVFEDLKFPKDVLNGVGEIDGITVKCINAESQVLFHLGYDFDENDVHDVKLLCKKFNIPIPKEYEKKIR